MSGLSRRQFLIRASAAALAPSLSIVAQPAQRVIIAGAGLAGLAAAYELAKAGYQVTVLEARLRPGGRVFTLRDQFADGLYVETGGEVAGDGYKRFLAYCNELNVPVDEAPDGARGLATLLRGKLFRPGAAIAPHPYGLKGDEALPPPQLLAKHLRALGEEAAQDPAKLAAFDTLSLYDALKARGVSASALDLLNIALNFNDIRTVSTAGVLWETRRRAAGGTKIMRVRGGNSRLTDALALAAAKAGAQFIYGQAVVQVTHSDSGVLVWTKDAELIAPLADADRRGKVHAAPAPLAADHFISTLPATALRGVQFEPPLPQAKADALAALPYTRVTKIWLQLRRAAWDAAGYGAGLWTDTELERVLPLFHDPAAKRGMFAVWLDGNAGTAAVDRLSNEERVRWAKRMLAQRLPPLADSVEGGTSIAWANDPWVRGAYAHFAPGQLTSVQPHLGTPEGRLHFAGEHTAEHAPGMEGALESGARVVAEITGK